MAEIVDRLNTAIQNFVSGGDFMVFWGEVMDLNLRLDPERDLALESRQVYDDLFDLVYMGQKGEPGRQDREDGLIGESELRRRLKDVQLLGRQPN